MSELSKPRTSSSDLLPFIESLLIESAPRQAAGAPRASTPRLSNPTPEPPTDAAAGAPAEPSNVVPLKARWVRCRDCRGEGRFNPSPRHDPQCELDCGACMGEGWIPA